MSDKKLTDSEIINLLKCCSKSTCSDCGYSKECDGYSSVNYALDLINRLQAKIDSFEKRQKPTAASGYKIENGKVVFFVDMLGYYSYEYKDLDEVVKTLNELLHEAYSKNEIVFALKCKTEELKTAKVEAYKEFADSLKKKAIYSGLVNADIVYKCDIDNLLKEMIGE